MPDRGPGEGMLSMTGMPTLLIGVSPDHLLTVMPGFPGMLYFGKSAVITTPPATQLLPVYQSDLLEGLPVPIG